MKHELKYVNIYKRSLMQSCLYGFAPDRELNLRADGFACCITAMFDTGDSDEGCNRLVADGSFGDAQVELLAAASDSLSAVLPDGREVNLAVYMANSRIPAAEKREVLESLPHVRGVGCLDILLHSLLGRYVWIYLAVEPKPGESCVLRGLRLEYPKYTFGEYFPEIYQGDDFFERYIAVFQSAFLDVERTVDEVPALLDYRNSDADTVEELAGWLGIDNSSGLFSSEQLRHIIERIDLFQGGKGTKAALEQIILLATGIRPRIVEAFQWNNPRLNAALREEYRTLYGDSENHFCVILDLTGTGGKLPVEQKALERLIESYSVMGSTFQLVCLDTCSHTGAHCYLGVNSRLITPELARADGIVLSGQTAVG